MALTAVTLVTGGCGGGGDPVAAVPEVESTVPSATTTASPGSYPPAEPLAHDPTTAQLRFAAEVDSICARNFNNGSAREDAIYATAELAGWSERKTEAASHENWAQSQADTVADVRALGEPPAARDLFRRWLANVERRGELFHEQSIAWARRDFAGTWRPGIKIDGLKIEANRLGQLFGLRICTSNGPNLLPGGQAHSLDRYLREVDETCERRRVHLKRYVDGHLPINERTANILVNEKFSIAAIPVEDEEQFAVRERILELASQPGPHSRAQLAGLGLPHCGH